MASRQLVRADRQRCQKHGEDTQLERTESGLKVNLHRRGMKAMSKKNAPIVIRSFIVPDSSLKKVWTFRFVILIRFTQLRNKLKGINILLMAIVI